MPRILCNIIAAVALLTFGTASANECLSKFPAGTQPIGTVKICQSSFTGLQDHYSCQDYRQGEERFRVIYKGGLEPRAIVKLSGNGTEQLIWSPRFGDHNMRCPLTAPMVIPKHAIHRGLGICQDDDDANIPCSIYEHSQARQSRSWRYLVFYHPDRSELAHQMPAGDNHNAMVAEIAYQLGLSLLDTRCCSEQASAYLEHAHHLFPKARVYRTGYLQALKQVAVNEDEWSDL